MRRQRALTLIFEKVEKNPEITINICHLRSGIYKENLSVWYSKQITVVL